jgi:rhodanese-related sulfurtransferase
MIPPGKKITDKAKTPAPICAKLGATPVITQTITGAKNITQIPKTVNIPMIVVMNNYIDILKKDQIYYILCHTGQRSYYLTKMLTEQGYNVVNAFGGITLMDEYYIHY